ncbi:pentapeptide repeat-containing protein [Frankia sp. AvcI1]|uniref:pentapeptide repeat-containing protein n=1 Tax=Frankia sp. AvcI1 TaxID=573496 RepID=UPI0027E0D375|nr:pentapeptide repeat-containing protein [Frankia sp. AvcI1]
MIAGLAGITAIAAVVGIWHLPARMYPGTGDGAVQARAALQGGLLTAAAALVAVAGALIALDETRQANAETRRANEAADAREREANKNTHVRELFTRAVDQLGSDNDTVRLGGIYALERIATDSPSDQRTVMEVLSAFVRTRSTDPDLRRATPPSGDNSVPPVRPAADIRAAVQVLARLPLDEDIPRADLTGADLTGPASLAGLQFPATANLAGVDLSRADLSGARLSGVNLAGIRGSGRVPGYPLLEGALLDDAVLTDAVLAGVRLESTRLTRANLVRAKLGYSTLTGDMTGADLTDADLWRANVEANLQDAILTRTRLSEARLDRSLNLSPEQVNEARGDSGTHLPGHITPPPGWPINPRHPR